VRSSVCSRSTGLLQLTMAAMPDILKRISSE
jgi:hypothetical protein